MQQRTEDARCYRMIAVHLKDPPEPGLVFPLLKDIDTDEDGDDSAYDDRANFQHVAASLISS